MATRTPLLRSDAQYHQYWGIYSAGAGAANLPKTAGVPIASTAEEPKLQVGDLAYNSVDSLLYICTSVGTPAVNDATWVAVTVGGASVRDAHEIVIGQSSAPYGDVVGVDADFVDVGDGLGLAAGLAAAAALGFFADVRLRPCSIDLNLVTSPGAITVPAGTRLIGAGRALQSAISGNAGTGNLVSQTIFVMSDLSTLEDLYLESPEPTVVFPVVATVGVVQIIGESVEVAHSFIRLRFNGQVRAQNACIHYDLTAGPSVFPPVISDCRFDSDSASVSTNASAAVVFGDLTGATFGISRYDWIVRDCATVGFNTAVRVANVHGGLISRCQFTDCEDYEAIRIRYTIAPGVPSIRGPRINETRITFTDTQVFAVPMSAILIVAALGPGQPVPVLHTEISDVSIVFAIPGVPDPASFRRGILLASGDDSTEIQDTTIQGVKISGHTTGIQLSAAALAGSVIRNTRITNCTAPDPLPVGAFFGVGLRVDSTSPGLIEDVGVHNCGFQSAGAGDFGVRLAGGAFPFTGISRTIIVGNALTPAGGTAILDDASLTEAGHNAL